MKKEHPTFGCSFDIDRIGDSPKLFVGIHPPSYDYVMTARTFGHAQASLACRSLILPVLLRLADVALVAELSHALCLGEELTFVTFTETDDGKQIYSSISNKGH